MDNLLYYNSSSMNNYHRTKYIDRIKKALKKEKLVLLYWQRQVWKTTLMKMLIEDDNLKGTKKIFSFEDTQKRNFVTKQDFLDYLQFEFDIDFYNNDYIFLDEVQYVENIVSILKSIYDDKSIKAKIIATGSWMWNIPNKAGSSLVWRWEELFIYPFSFEEFLWLKWKDISILDYQNYNKVRYDIVLKLYEEYLIWWWYPEVIKANTQEQKQNELKKIVKRFFEKDVIFWFNKDEMIEFEKIYYYIYQNIWNLLKIDNLSNITWVGNKKLVKYLNFLKRSLVIFEIKPFFQDKSKEIFSHWKIYLSDLGIFSFMWKNYGWKLQDGKVIENYTFLEILKNNPNVYINFYKKKNGTEIDLIIQNWKWQIIPVEVKSWKSNAIPKIFYSFEKDFADKIYKYIKTTSNIKERKTIKDKELNLVPNFLIWNAILF